MSTPAEWFVRLRSGDVGPFDNDGIRAIIGRGLITRETPVRRGISGVWAEAGLIPQLAEMLPIVIVADATPIRPKKRDNGIVAGALLGGAILPWFVIAAMDAFSGKSFFAVQMIIGAALALISIACAVLFVVFVIVRFVKWSAED